MGEAGQPYPKLKLGRNGFACLGGEAGNVLPAIPSSVRNDKGPRRWEGSRCCSSSAVLALFLAEGAV